ncbi:MAG: dihydrofolate reductase [Streptosporangiales bacterium]|nr:dihydrofolate reductase [Streptosporangiales bacterium]
MRKLVLYTLLSLDGVAESPDRYVFDFDDEMYANLTRVIEAQDAVLLGRRTYDDWASYWPTSNDEPFAGFINGVHKYVVTSTQPATLWTNTTVVTDAVPQFVRDLKEQPGGDIGVHGSIRLARSLIGSGLADELRLVIAPALAGGGRKLFKDEDNLRKLELLRAVGTPSGALLVDYRV